MGFILETQNQQLTIPFHSQLTQAYLSFPRSHGLRYAHPKQIIYVKAMSNYCKIFFSDGSSLVVAKVLAWFENKLGDDFLRIHRSHLVNRHHICSLKTNHYPKVVLSNGDELSVSKRKKHAVKVLMLG